MSTLALSHSPVRSSALRFSPQKWWTLHPKRFLSAPPASRGGGKTTTMTRPCNLQRRNARRADNFSTSRTAATQSTHNNKNGSFPYGLQRVDYTKAPPPRWILPPPPPPSKNPVRRHFGNFTLVACTALFVWIYFNQDESVYDYWRSVEQGDVPVEGDDDDDDDDEDLDLSNVDEWEDNDGKKQ